MHPCKLKFLRDCVEVEELVGAVLSVIMDNTYKDMELDTEDVSSLVTSIENWLHKVSGSYEVYFPDKKVVLDVEEWNKESG